MLYLFHHVLQLNLIILLHPLHLLLLVLFGLMMMQMLLIHNVILIHKLVLILQLHKNLMVVLLIHLYHFLMPKAPYLLQLLPHFHLMNLLVPYSNSMDWMFYENMNILLNLPLQIHPYLIFLNLLNFLNLIFPQLLHHKVTQNFLTYVNYMLFLFLLYTYYLLFL